MATCATGPIVAALPERTCVGVHLGGPPALRVMDKRPSAAGRLVLNRVEIESSKAAFNRDSEVSSTWPRTLVTAG